MCVFKTRKRRESSHSKCVEELLPIKQINLIAKIVQIIRKCECFGDQFLRHNIFAWKAWGHKRKNSKYGIFGSFQPGYSCASVLERTKWNVEDKDQTLDCLCMFSISDFSMLCLFVCFVCIYCYESSLPETVNCNLQPLLPFK